MLSSARRNAGKILVVEDNSSVIGALAGLLRLEGYDPVLFDCGQPAIEYACNGGHRPDAALIDIHLPDVSGLDVTQKLRDTYGDDLPIIVLSGDNSIDTLRALPAVGATYFFSKPVNAASLLDQLRQWMAA